MHLCDYETTECGVAFFSWLWMTELLLKKWLPVGYSFRVAKFLFCKQLCLLEEFAVLDRGVRPFALVAMVNIGLGWTINGSAFGIFAIAFTTSDGYSAVMGGC